MTQTAGIYLLTPEHEAAVQALLADSSVAEVLRVAHPVGPDGARVMLARDSAERAAGNGHAFAIEDRRVFVGITALKGIGSGIASELICCVASGQRGKGYATFAIGMTLEFAFRNLRLARVRASVPEINGAAQRVLEKCGFAAVSNAASHDPHALQEINREQWMELRNRAALAALHPSLRAMVDAEVDAGNEVTETGTGWPEPGSVFVRLAEPFRVIPPRLPEGVTYFEPNDPHWWKAEYSTPTPRHIVAH